MRYDIYIYIYIYVIRRLKVKNHFLIIAYVLVKHCCILIKVITSVHSLGVFNPLNAELNPICHLLALLGGATIVVVSRLRVNNDLPESWLWN